MNHANVANLFKYGSSLRNISTNANPWQRLKYIDKVLPKNVLEGYINDADQPNDGVVHDVRPFKLYLEKGKTYKWCACGHSKSQPLCDNTHKILQFNIKMKPILFQVEESKEYWLCQCKQTVHRPFCDGSHIPLAEERRQKRAAALARKAEEQGKTTT